MTIKEIEALSGMTRANIRFYEAEGLLAPQRGENGYRNYSLEDLETLKRIKLLRTLRIPLEEIRALHQEKEELRALLSRHLTTLELEQEELSRSQRVCQEMCSDGAEYQTLDAQRYLDSLNRIPKADSEALAADVLPTVKAPLRRLLARILDLQWYSALWSVFLILVCHRLHRETPPAILFDHCASLVLMLCAEPFLLHRFGTTPGKWILGLGVTDPYGQRLTLSAAFVRTWRVLWRGMGWEIPFYNLYRLNESHQACERGEPLPWEQDSTLTLQKTKKRRMLAYAAGYTAPVGLVLLTMAIAVTPPNRGDITPEEFYENFNHAAIHQHLDLELTSYGHWLKKEPDYDRRKFHFPSFTLTERDGAVTEVHFRYETTDSTLTIPSFREPMLLAGLAFAGAEEGILLYPRSYSQILHNIQDNEFRDFCFSAGGVTFLCEVEYSGYDWDWNYPEPGYLVPQAGAETAFSLHFSMVKTG